jgi:hypothetical protein
MKDGRRFGRPPNPYRPPDAPAGKINLTDPDSRNVKTSRGWVQGYNAQAVVTEQPDRDLVQAGTAACTRSCVACSPANAAASSTPDAKA